MTTSSPRSVSSRSSCSTFEFDGNSSGSGSSSGNSSSNSRYNAELRTLNELSRRGLVMKSPFFQMTDEASSPTPSNTSTGTGSPNSSPLLNTYKRPPVGKLRQRSLNFGENAVDGGGSTNGTPRSIKRVSSTPIKSIPAISREMANLTSDDKSGEGEQPESGDSGVGRRRRLSGEIEDGSAHHANTNLKPVKNTSSTKDGDGKITNINKDNDVKGFGLGIEYGRNSPASITTTTSPGGGSNSSNNRETTIISLAPAGHLAPPISNLSNSRSHANNNNNNNNNNKGLNNKTLSTSSSLSSVKSDLKSFDSDSSLSSFDLNPDYYSTPKPLPSIPTPELPSQNESAFGNDKEEDLESVDTVDTSIVEEDEEEEEDEERTPTIVPPRNMTTTNAASSSSTSLAQFPLDQSTLNRDHEPLKLGGGHVVTAAATPRMRNQVNSIYEKDMMSRQSVLDAFENDIRDLLAMERQKEETKRLTKTSSSAGFEQMMDEELVYDHHSNPPSLGPSLGSSNSHRRTSRSTVSSYGDAHTTELDPEDPKSKVPEPLLESASKSVAARPALKQPLFAEQRWHDVHQQKRSMSNINKAQIGAPVLSKMPTNDSTISLASGPISPVSPISPPKKLNRMHSDLEGAKSHSAKQRSVSSGKGLSLRRKSAATLRLSTLSLHSTAAASNTSPTKEGFSMPPTPSTTQLLAATFDGFLNSKSSQAVPAHWPTDPTKIGQWFLRQLLASKSNPGGAYLTDRLYIPSELWQVDTISPKLLHSRLKCLNDLTKVGAEHAHQTNLAQLDKQLEQLEQAFHSAFISPLNENIGGNGNRGSLSPPRRTSTNSQSSSSGMTTPISPMFSSPQSSQPSSRHGSTQHVPTSSMFKRLRKKSTVASEISSPMPAADQPQELFSAMSMITLDHYLSALASLANALEAVQQQYNETNCGGEWLKRYRKFISHVCCRLVLKDVQSLQDIYKSDFREYLIR